MAKKYLIRFAFFVLGTGLLAMATGVVVDPFGAYGFVRIEGFNSIKPAGEKNEKLAKSMRVAVVKPEALIMGTSRSEFGLDPTHSGFAQYGTAYNLALADCNVYLTRRFLQHAIALAAPEALVFGLDFFTFNAHQPPAPDYREEYMAQTPDGHRNSGYLWAILKATTFSLNSLSKGLETVWSGRSHNGPGVDLDSGLRAPVRNGRFLDMRLHLESAPHSRDNPNPPADSWSIRSSFLRSERLYVEGAYFRGLGKEYGFVYPDSNHTSFDEFNEILRLCSEHDIDLYLVISPPHARQMELIRQMGLWPLFEQWKRLLVASVTDAEAKWDREIPLWDFSGYNRITNEQVPPQGYMDYYLDTAHYSIVVGDLILNRVFGLADPDAGTGDEFGVRLKSDTVEQVIEQIRRGQEAYQRNNAEDVAEITTIIEDAAFATRDVAVTGSGASMAAKVAPKRARGTSPDLAGSSSTAELRGPIGN